MTPNQKPVCMAGICNRVVNPINLEPGITEKIDMEKDLKVFFQKKDFWHSISKQLRSTNLITTYKLIEYEKNLLFSRHS
jgi:hypothetical protein